MPDTLMPSITDAGQGQRRVSHNLRSSATHPTPNRGQGTADGAEAIPLHVGVVVPSTAQPRPPATDPHHRHTGVGVSKADDLEVKEHTPHAPRPHK